MAIIKVKAVEGRIARRSKNGDFIPSDRFVRVEHTPYIDRLIHVHGDLLVEPEAAPVAVPPTKANKETA